MMITKKIRIGVLLDSLTPPAWIHRLIQLLTEHPDAELSLIILNEASTSPIARATASGKISRIPRAIARRLADFIYENLIQRSPLSNDVLRSSDIGSLVQGIPVLRTTPHRAKWTDRIIPEDIQKIREMAPDILIRGGFRILKGEILKVPRYGIWSLHHGDNLVNRGGPACFWESIKEWPATGTVLQMLTEELDDGLILYRSWSSTDPYSVRVNRNVTYWKSLHFILRKISELRRLGETEFTKRVEAENQHPRFYSNRLFKRPGEFQWLYLALRKLVSKSAHILDNRIYFRQWQLRYCHAPSPATAFYRYKKIIPPKDRFWADPHVMEKDGKHFIFIEEYLFQCKKGHISLITADANGHFSEPVPVLRRPYHLSYPFVFSWGDKIYMIPETASNRTVELYECTEFPMKWEWRMNLMEEVRAVDATLHHDGYMWWMFVNIAQEEGASTWDELHLYSSPSLLSNQWAPHPMNPIVSDCRNSRPAGKLFVHQGNLYRPSQNCAKRYGYGLNLNRVIRLTESEYQEELVSEAVPNWEKDLLATHSFSCAGNLNVIDVQVRRRR